MEKIFNQKVKYFVWTPLGSRDNIWINFFPQFNFKVYAVWYCYHYFPLVLTTPAVPACVVDTAGKFATGVVDTGGKFAAGVIHSGGAPWLANISANFQKSWIDPIIFRGLGEDASRKKSEKKFRDTVPLNILLNLIKVTNSVFFVAYTVINHLYIWRIFIFAAVSFFYLYSWK